MSLLEECHREKLYMSTGLMQIAVVQHIINTLYFFLISSIIILRFKYLGFLFIYHVYEHLF